MQHTSENKKNAIKMVVVDGGATALTFTYNNYIFTNSYFATET